MHVTEDIISQLTLRCKGTFACFDMIFTRGTTYDFLFAFFDKELELLKGKNLLLWNQNSFLIRRKKK